MANGHITGQLEEKEIIVVKTKNIPVCNCGAMATLRKTPPKTAVKNGDEWFDYWICKNCGTNISTVKTSVNN